MYLEKEDLRKAPYNISEDDLDEAAVEVVLDITKSLIDRYCRQSFDKEGIPTPIEKRLSGTGTITMFTPKRLLTLSVVKIYLTELSFTTYSVDNFIVKPRYIEWKSMSPESHRVIVDHFPIGKGNVGIIGSWGYDAPPATIKYAQGRMIMNLVRDGAINKQKSSENVGDYNYQNIIREDGMTFDPEIDTILKSHRDFRVDIPA